MPKEVAPSVFIVAATAIDLHGRGKFLEAIGAPPGWSSDAKNDAEELIEIAGKSCYLSFSVDLNKNLTRVGTRTDHDYIQQQLVGARHGSVLEHGTVTFAFVNVSRVFTHELVRHRVGAAYSQVSGRYVRTDELGYFMPSCIAKNPRARERFYEAFSSMEKWMRALESDFKMAELKDFGLKKTLTSAFRRLIGNGQSNHIVATFNHRTIRHLIEMRTNRGAEEEIRLVFSEVFAMVRERFPAIYADAMTIEVDGIDEVSFPIGRV